MHDMYEAAKPEESKHPAILGKYDIIPSTGAPWCGRSNMLWTRCEENPVHVLSAVWRLHQLQVTSRWQIYLKSSSRWACTLWLLELDLFWCSAKSNPHPRSINRFLLLSLFSSTAITREENNGGKLQSFSNQWRGEEWDMLMGSVKKILKMQTPWWWEGSSHCCPIAAHSLIPVTWKH